MSKKPEIEGIPHLRILTIRGRSVLLDRDLGLLYGVETRSLNQAVKRNIDRFPEEFSFHLTREEIERVSQTVIPLARLKFSNYVRAFTEHGVLQAANVLNSPRATQMSLYIIRAFVKMREEYLANADIFKRLAQIDKTLLEHDAALRATWAKLQPLLAPPPAAPRRIKGFNPREE